MNLYVRILVSFYLLIPINLFGLPYCVTEDFIAIEKPFRDFTKGKDVVWIVFHFDKINLDSSSWDTIDTPFYFNQGGGEMLLDITCMKEHLRFSIGSKKGSFQVIYKIALKKSSFQLKEKLRTFYRSRLKNILKGAPVKIKISKLTHFEFEYMDKMKELHPSLIRTTRSLVARAIVKGKVIKHWTLATETSDMTVDPY